MSEEHITGTFIEIFKLVLLLTTMVGLFFPQLTLLQTEFLGIVLFHDQREDNHPYLWKGLHF